MLGQIISSLSSFLLAIAFANLLPKEAYGTYKYILSIAGILAIPTLSGINTSIVQATARGYEGSFLPALKTKIRWGLLGGLASLALAGYYYFNNNFDLTIAFLIAAFFLPIMDPLGIYDSFLQGKKLFKISTKYWVFSQLIASLCLITTLFFTKNLPFILLAYFTPWTLLRFIFLKITLKKFPPNQQKDDQTISYGKHLSLLSVLGSITNYADRLLIFHYLGAAQVAVYSIAIAMPEQIKGVLKNINTLAFPKFSQRKNNEIKGTLGHHLKIYILILVLITLAYILLCPSIFKIFFPKYQESIIYSQLYSVTISAIAIATLLLTLLTAQKTTKILYQINIYSFFLQITLLFIGVYFFGLMGVIVSRIIGRFLGLLLIQFLTNREKNNRFSVFV